MDQRQPLFSPLEYRTWILLRGTFSVQLQPALEFPSLLYSRLERQTECWSFSHSGSETWVRVFYALDRLCVRGLRGVRPLVLIVSVGGFVRRLVRFSLFLRFSRFFSDVRRQSSGVTSLANKLTWGNQGSEKVALNPEFLNSQSYDR